MSRNFGPKLPTYVDDGGYTWVFCDWCVMYHSHGLGLGPRAAHCLFDDSPYKHGGYDMRYAGVFDDDRRKAAARLQREAWRRLRKWRREREAPPGEHYVNCHSDK